MSNARDIAIQGIQNSFSEAVEKISSTFGVCLIDAQGDARREAECRQSRDRGLTFAKRTFDEMLEAVKRQWPE
jgi:hypothetical protein